MGLPSRKEVEGALERGVVGDVKWLGEALLEALDHLKEHAPHLIHEAEHRAAQYEVDELRTLVRTRAHLANDGAADRLASAEKRLEDMTRPATPADPDLGPEQNPVVDNDPDRGPKTEVAEHPPSHDPDAEVKPPYDKGSSAPTSGAHPGIVGQNVTPDGDTKPKPKKKAAKKKKTAAKK